MKKEAARVTTLASVLTFLTFVGFRFWLLPRYEWDAKKIAVVAAFWAGLLGICEWVYHRLRKR